MNMVLKGRVIHMFPETAAQYYNILSVLELSWEPRKDTAHSRDYHALSLRIDGDAVFECPDRSIHVGAGEIIFVPKGMDYTLNANTQEHLFVIHFDTIPDIPHEFTVFHPSNTVNYEVLFRKIHQIWQYKQPGYRFGATSLFFQLLEQLSRENAKKEPQSSNDKLSYIIAYIHGHYTDPSLSVATLSGMYGSSSTYFRRIFIDAYGIPPLQYINRLKINRATELLSSGYYTVAEAAYATGFSDPKYFSRFVIKETGIAPSKMKGIQNHEQK